MTKEYEEKRRLVIMQWEKEAIERINKVVFTCDRCSDNLTCQFSLDPYNTNGDCLAEK